MCIQNKAGYCCITGLCVCVLAAVPARLMLLLYCAGTQLRPVKVAINGRLGDDHAV